MHDDSRIAKFLLTSLAVGSAIYCLVALWYVATTPDIGLRCLLAEDESAAREAEEITVVDGSHLDPLPKKGDRLIEVAGFRTRTFVDFAHALAWVRSPPRDAAVGNLTPGVPVSEVPEGSTNVLQKDSTGRYYVRVLFRPGDGGVQKRAWVPLARQPIGGLALSLGWFVMHTIVFVLAGLAYWRRPSDRPLQVFFALCAVTVVAYVGGNHWWVLAGSLWFTIPFAVMAILLPAVLLHFFLVYPVPKRFLFAWPRLTLLGVYGVPATFAIGAVVLIVAGDWLSRVFIGPAITATFAGMSVDEFMPLLRNAIYVYLMIAAGYFVFAIVALVDSFWSTRNPLERAQVRWILCASLLATVPVALTLWLAYFDRVAFAFGSARLPMVLASLSFTCAYAVGIARYKLLLIDQVVNRGMLYYVASVGLTIVFALLIAAVGVFAWTEATSAYGYALPVIVVLALAVIALGWLRDRAQRAIDLWFFREKYALDRALQRMNRAVSSLLERDDVAENMLYTCCEVLRISDAALYLRDPAGSRFRLVTAVGQGSVPLQFEADEDLLNQIGQGVSLQRVPSGTSPPQMTLRQLHAELMHGLEVDGETIGLVALGGKPNAAAYTAEDVTFLTAVGRITGVALHCAKVHEDMSRLHQELQRKAEKISEQSRQIAVLQSELADSAGLRSPSSNESDFRRGQMRGHSPAIVDVLDTVRKVAPSDASVLIRGESGTGKELLARAIHDNSPRRDGPLVAVHCAALAPSLLESELFGHVRGAFTDARDDKVGRFALANGGTLFLDEIGDISLDIQIKLLRALQERTIEPVGGTQSVRVDVRMVAATHRNLEQLIAEGRFREDLYYRLNVVSITLPPLRERGDDIFELALFFLRRATERTGKRITQFDDQAITALMQHHWPGNIRELENVVERAVVLAEGDRITLEAFPLPVRGGSVRPSTSSAPPSRSAILQPRAAALRTRAPLAVASDDEPAVLLDALDRCRGNKAEAARLLNMPRSTFHSKLKKYGLG
ncbi:MAG: sigma 54-interacting transcriptional regulator [Planctomycetaceae bacterium]